MSKTAATLPTGATAGSRIFILETFSLLRATARRRSGGAYRDRTDDPLLAKQVLSQLS